MDAQHWEGQKLRDGLSEAHGTKDILVSCEMCVWLEWLFPTTSCESVTFTEAKQPHSDSECQVYSYSYSIWQID